MHVWVFMRARVCTYVVYVQVHAIVGEVRWMCGWFIEWLLIGRKCVYIVTSFDIDIATGNIM